MRGSFSSARGAPELVHGVVGLDGVVLAVHYHLLLLARQQQHGTTTSFLRPAHLAARKSRWIAGRRAWILRAPQRWSLCFSKCPCAREGD
jgi:hypothetical protein